MTVKMRVSKNKENDYQNEETRVQIFVQQMLITRIFVASYIGRFYVESLKDYRDVIQIYEEEKDLLRDLSVVKKRIDCFYRGMLWPAITQPEMMESPTGHCLWVKLRNIPLGTFWFSIEEVTFSKEVVIRVKHIRDFKPEVTPTMKNNDSINYNEIKNNVYHCLREIITWHNTKESAKFTFALLMTIATTLLYGLQYLGDYSIRFFGEFNNLIRVLTPILLAVLDVITKTIGGFYLLIAMLWRGQPPRLYPSIQAPPPRQFRPVRQPHYSGRDYYE